MTFLIQGNSLMHEMTYIVPICNTAIDQAKKNKAKSITALHIEIGEMTAVIPSIFRSYFGEASKNTILENAELKLKMIPVKANCLKCSHTFKPEKKNDYRCPNCGSNQSKIIEGREVILKSIEIEESS